LLSTIPKPLKRGYREGQITHFHTSLLQPATVEGKDYAKIRLLAGAERRALPSSRLSFHAIRSHCCSTHADFYDHFT
jgi:hypothetical protein